MGIGTMILLHLIIRNKVKSRPLKRRNTVAWYKLWVTIELLRAKSKEYE